MSRLIRLNILIGIIFLKGSSALPRFEIPNDETGDTGPSGRKFQEEYDTGTEAPAQSSTDASHFIFNLLNREGSRDPWLAQLIKAAVPVLAEEGFGGVIRQSFKLGPSLAIGAAYGLANQRIGPLLNFPAPPTTTLIPPYKRLKKDESDLVDTSTVADVFS